MSSEIEFEVDTSEIKKFLVDLSFFTKDTAEALVRFIDDAALELQTQVKLRASGRPGPMIQTGQYLNSILLYRNLETNNLGFLLEESVYTNAPQARRLEYGFVGIDSRGRRYHQPPFPHWRPAVDELDAHFKTDLDREVKGWWHKR